MSRLTWLPEAESYKSGTDNFGNNGDTNPNSEGHFDDSEDGPDNTDQETGSGDHGSGENGSGEMPFPDGESHYVLSIKGNFL